MNLKGNNAKEKSRIKVFVRCRPLTEEEAESGTCVSIDDKENTIKVKRSAYHTKDFQFDGIFGFNSTQESIYQAVAKEALDDVFKGYHGTIFAYGQTGTGKTFTISCQQKGFEGIIPRAIDDIFHRIRSDTENDYTVRMSYVQIYMEMIQDLLNPENNSLQIREDPISGVYIAGVHTQEVKNPTETLQFYNIGDENRVTALTKMNATSSRSHACLILNIEKRSRVNEQEYSEEMDNKRVTRANLFLVDLAGSERLKKTAATGVRKMEAKYINLSLTTLGIVINALESYLSHVPFRDSKLTRLLQDSLSGNGKTRIIVTVGPSTGNCQETVSALQFGQRAMNVQTVAKVNQTVDYKVMCMKLQQQLEELENRYRGVQSDLEEVLNENDRLERDLSDQREKVATLNDMLKLTSQSVETEKQELLKMIESDLVTAERNKFLVEELTKQIEELRSKHENEIQDTEEEYRAQQVAQERVIYTLEEQMQEKEREASILSTENQNLSEHVNRLNNQLLTTSEELNKLQSGYDNIRMEQQSLAEENSREKARISELVNDNEELKLAVRKLTDSSQLLEKQRIEDSTSIMHQEHRISELTQEILSLNSELDVARDEIVKLKNDNETLLSQKEDLYHNNIQFVSESSYLSEEVKKLENDVKNAEVMNKQLRDELSEVKSQSKSTTDRLSLANSELNEKDNRLKNNETTIQDLLSETSDLRQKYEESCKIITNLQAQCSSIIDITSSFETTSVDVESSTEQGEDSSAPSPISRIIEDLKTKYTNALKASEEGKSMLDRLRSIVKQYCNEKIINNEIYLLGKVIHSVVENLDGDDITKVVLDSLSPYLKHDLSGDEKSHSTTNEISWRTQIEETIQFTRSQETEALPLCPDESVNAFISSIMRNQASIEPPVFKPLSIEEEYSSSCFKFTNYQKELISDISYSSVYNQAYQRLVVRQESFKNVQIDDSQSDPNQLLDTLEEYLKHDLDLSLLSSCWLNTSWVLLSLMAKRTDLSIKNDHYLRVLIALTNDISTQLLGSGTHAGRMNRVLFECAIELSKHAGSFNALQQKIEIKFRSERAARKIQKLWKGYKKRQNTTQEKKLVEENQKAMKKIAELSRSKEALVSRLEQSNVETGQMLMRQSYQELESLFETMRKYFLWDVPKKTPDSPSSSLGTPTSGSSFSSPKTPEEQRKLKRHSTTVAQNYGEQRSRFFGESMVNMDDFSMGNTSPTNTPSPINRHRSSTSFMSSPLLRSNSYTGITLPSAMRSQRNRSSTNVLARDANLHRSPFEESSSSNMD